MKVIQAIDPERLESLKAGAIAAGAGAVMALLIVWLDHPWTPQLQPVLRVATAVVCAFLFGVTYRYIIRQDVNPHLRSGAVGAFALTRGLSQLEASDLSQLAPATLLPIGESFGLFLAIRLVLDWSLSQRWLRPFISSERESKPG